MLWAPIIIVLLEPFNQKLVGWVRSIVACALREGPVKKGQVISHYVVLELIVIKALQYVPRVKRVTNALDYIELNVRLVNTV